MFQGREDLVQLEWDRLVAYVDDGMTEQGGEGEPEDCLKMERTKLFESF